MAIIIYHRNAYVKLRLRIQNRSIHPRQHSEATTIYDPK